MKNSVHGIPVVIKGDAKPSGFFRLLGFIPYVNFLLLFLPSKKEEFSFLFTSSSVIAPVKDPFEGEQIPFSVVKKVEGIYNNLLTREVRIIFFFDENGGKIFTMQNVSEVEFFLEKFVERGILVERKMGRILKFVGILLGLLYVSYLMDVFY